MTEVVDEVFKTIDEKVNGLIEEHPVERGDQLEKLSKLYWDSWEHLECNLGIRWYLHLNGGMKNGTTWTNQGFS